MKKKPRKKGQNLKVKNWGKSMKKKKRSTKKKTSESRLQIVLEITQWL
jgi:hypothetical protein